ncbi:transmembrane protein, putative (macronuclear) [Tetrahymena thermophila SB210]|uniref:Transmembrane protein, putative n=1 Tax=Tetrahymena thermophila (strain SB210) TaxID=312017 RepID=Q23DJ2_TETTS|nr:transmembrane protein, putative [Tetrahymena thermophila SB210]EAR94465.3 transmembrane protein, putative [Tetrahymena thermophila SB210]|eukprot:XP_001014694.3 transmembrane protein, putative [Tetrahymena thermophila SB210]
MERIKQILFQIIYQKAANHKKLFFGRIKFQFKLIQLISTVKKFWMPLKKIFLKQTSRKSLNQSIVNQDIHNTSNDADLKKNRSMRLMQRLEKKYSEQGDQKTLLENNENLETSSIQTNQSQEPAIKITSNEFKQNKPQQTENQGISGSEKLELMKKKDQIIEKYDRLSIIICAVLGVILAILSKQSMSVNFLLIFVSYQLLYQIIQRNFLLARINSLLNQGQTELNIGSFVSEKANKAINLISHVSRFSKVFRQLADDISAFLFTFVVFSQILQRF